MKDINRRKFLKSLPITLASVAGLVGLGSLITRSKSKAQVKWFKWEIDSTTGNSQAYVQREGSNNWEPVNSITLRFDTEDWVIDDKAWRTY